MKRKFVKSILSLSICLAVYAALIATSPLPYRVVDRDSSGVVSLLEAVDAHDVGQRESPRGAQCIEYFWFKDGLPAYEKCSGASTPKP